MVAQATSDSIFTRLKRKDKHTYSLQILTVWLYKPPQCCLKKKTKNTVPYILTAPRIMYFVELKTALCSAESLKIIVIARLIVPPLSLSITMDRKKNYYVIFIWD